MSDSSGQGAGSGSPLGILSAPFQIIEGYNKGRSLQIQADFDAQQQDFNAEQLLVQRKDLLENSEKQADLIEREAKQIVGTQKAALAAQGIDLGSDVAGLLEEDTRFTAREDVLATRNNAWRQALGLEIASDDLKIQAKFTRLTGKSQRRQAITQGIADGVSTFASSLPKGPPGAGA